MRIVYEFYYVIGQHDFSNIYILKASKETERIIYGKAYTFGDEQPCGNFMLNISKIGTLSTYVDKKHGSFCKIWIEQQENVDPKMEAHKLIYNYLISIANQLKGDE